jgi:hypothetical protein
MEISKQHHQHMLTFAKLFIALYEEPIADTNPIIELLKLDELITRLFPNEDYPSIKGINAFRISINRNRARIELIKHRIETDMTNLPQEERDAQLADEILCICFEA